MLCAEGLELGKIDVEIEWGDLVTPGLQMTLACVRMVMVATGTSGYILTIIRK